MWRRVRMSSRKEFQFTPLREGRQSESEQAQLNPDFNSRPSARGDLTLDEVLVTAYISIHAPPRGATRSARSCILH